jgi:hypothetical protein
MCPRGTAPMTLSVRVTFTINDGQVQFPLVMYDSYQYAGFLYAGCGTYQARFGDSTQCSSCSAISPSIAYTDVGQQTTSNIGGLLFLRFATGFTTSNQTVAGLSNRIEVTAGWLGAGPEWFLKSGGSGVQVYNDINGPSNSSNFHWLSTSTYASSSDPCYQDMPQAGAVPLYVRSKFDQAVLDGSLAIEIYNQLP